jgi:hypothetical protein
LKPVSTPLAAFSISAVSLPAGGLTFEAVAISSVAVNCHGQKEAPRFEAKAEMLPTKEASP